LTDCKNLECFIKVQNLNRRQACWVLYLSRFNFTLKHILGTKIGKTDRLSRRLDWKVRTKNNNENQKEEWIWELVEVVVERSEVDIDILEKIKIARENDEKVVRIENKKGWSKSIKRGQMANRRRDGVEERKSIYTKE